MNTRLFGIIVLILAGVSVPMFFPSTFYNALELHKIPASQTGNLLAQLVFYALVIERITEIFIEASFSGQKTEIKSKYIYEQKSVSPRLSLVSLSEFHSPWWGLECWVFSSRQSQQSHPLKFQYRHLYETLWT